MNQTCLPLLSLLYIVNDMKSTNNYYGQASSYTGGGGYGQSAGGGAFGNSPLYNHPPPRSPFSGAGGYSQQYYQQQYPPQGKLRFIMHTHVLHVLIVCIGGYYPPQQSMGYGGRPTGMGGGRGGGMETCLAWYVLSSSK